MSAHTSLSGVGNYKVDVIDATTSALDLYSRPYVDTSLINGNDIHVSIKIKFLLKQTVCDQINYYFLSSLDCTSRRVD